MNSLKTETSWKKFWENEETWTYPDLYKISAQIFFDRAQKYVQWKKQDTVLNYGCGPGFLEALLAPEVSSIDAVDISEKMIRRCKLTCLDHPQVYAHTISDINELSKTRKFSLFLCISVAQYFDSIDEFENLLLAFKDRAAPGARIVLADLPQYRSFFQSLKDLSKASLLAFQGGYGKLLIQKVFKEFSRFYVYQEYSKHVNHLYFQRDQVLNVLTRCQLKGQWIHEDLSIMPGRLNILIQLP